MSALPYNPKIIRRRVWKAIRLHETSVIANAASLDKLTGLYNREGVFVKAAEMIGSHEPRYYVLSSLDINNFKVINDQYGISKGDEILKFIAEKIARRFEPHGGICPRFSADNFAILYPCSFIASEKKINLENLNFVLAGVQTPITISVGRYVVESIVRMAKWLGMSVIAEGVETAAQAEYLKSIGCCYVQGYLLPGRCLSEIMRLWQSGQAKRRKCLFWRRSGIMTTHPSGILSQWTR